jgi:hypothetical protein
MSTTRTKCPFCRRRYIRAGAYEKHLESYHPDMYKNLFRLQTDLLRSRSPSVNLTGNEEAADHAFSFNESDYESDPVDSEPEHDSDGEDNPVSRSYSSNTTQIQAYDNAGRSLRDVPSNQRYETSLLAEPWRPFLTLDDFKLANWFVTSKVPRSRIDEYFAIGLSKSASPCFKSAYTLDQYIAALDPYQHFLEWKEGTYTHDGHASTFFYRDMVQCVEYLLSQPAYRDDVVYAPVREQNETGERLYSEMHTADWWWETQVSIFSSTNGGLTTF